ncbi:MAG: aspartate--tRNA ligase [Flavobacteriales bacterium]|nr:aspartate--tRNA ligase [Flavobacteriales bacterium]
MFRTHNCGELNISHIDQNIQLSGWIQKSRDLGGLTFIDLRDRYGITQLIFNIEKDENLCLKARKLGRECVIHIEGIVVERSSKNKKIKTGEIEINVIKLNILNLSKSPPFTIENNTDGGDDLRMKFRYLDLRRPISKNKIIFRSKIVQEIRKFLNSNEFIEIETPVLIKSTPEGARDFIVPSRMNEGQFYALPQSPQTFKQLLMVSGFDKYFQIVKCFRDEDLRADRQPEFTQIDCEMSFVTQDEILNKFENLIKYLFDSILNVKLNDFPRISYEDAMKNYGNDKPDIRFDMKLHEINNLTKNKGFEIFDNSELILGINANECSNYSRKSLDEITNWVKRPQIGASGLIYIKFNTDKSIKSSIDKFFNTSELKKILDYFKAKPGDLILILSGMKNKVRKQMSELRIMMANRMGLIKKNEFAPIWIIDFPLLEWDDESNRFHAMHHPFTSPKQNHIDILSQSPEKVLANAYDLVLNGNEIGGGSIRIHDMNLQKLLFKLLGFSEKEAQNQFGFLMNAFEYGAPPHGGIALGLDRLCALLDGNESIRDYIAFPKNNSGRDIMIDAPSHIDNSQLSELNLKLDI